MTVVTKKMLISFAQIVAACKAANLHLPPGWPEEDKISKGANVSDVEKKADSMFYYS